MTVIQMTNGKDTTKENIIARLLGADEHDGRLLKFTGDNESERIGNFRAIKDIADQIDDNSIDYRVSFSDISSEVFNDNISLSIKDRDVNGLVFSNNGLSNLCGQLDIPALYIKKSLMAEEIGHARDTLNFWIDRVSLPEKEILLRTTNNRIHGMLSSKYSVFDDHEVLDITEGLLGGYNNYAVKDYHINPEYMKLRIVSRDKININGRDLSFGFDLKNSRVGKSSLEVSILIFDWVCSNGLIFGGGIGSYYKRRHVGIDREAFITEFVEILNDAPNAVEFIKKSATAAHNEKLDSKAIQNHIDRFKAQNFSMHMAGKVQQMMEEKYENTLYGFSAAITETAQEYDVVTRERMEKFAGNLIYLLSKKTA